VQRIEDVFLSQWSSARFRPAMPCQGGAVSIILDADDIKKNMVDTADFLCHGSLLFPRFWGPDAYIFL
jgi:hypothetical protein